MLRTIGIYIRGRFSLRLFTLLAAFLMLYANGRRWDLAGGALCFLYTLFFLFWFRLFDDLASHRVDAGKPGRIYTGERARRELRLLLAPSALLLVAATLWLDMRAGIILGIYIPLQSVAYRLLFDRRGWRHLLPLGKYPVIALLLMMGARTLGMGDLAASLSLLPVFMLFEWLDDPSYHLPAPAALMLLAGAHLLLAPAMRPEWYPAALGGMALVALLGYRHRRSPIAGAPYLLMLYFLLLRAGTIDHGV